MASDNVPVGSASDKSATIAVSTRVPRSEKRLMAIAAAHVNEKLAAFVRKASLDRALAVMEQQTQDQRRSA